MTKKSYLATCASAIECNDAANLLCSGKLNNTYQTFESGRSFKEILLNLQIRILKSLCTPFTFSNKYFKYSKCQLCHLSKYLQFLSDIFKDDITILNKCDNNAHIKL